MKMTHTYFLLPKMLLALNINNNNNNNNYYNNNNDDSSGGGGGGGGGGGAGEGRDYHVKAQQLLLMRVSHPG